MSEKKRSDVVGEEMGKMLLKGYRMLATSCDRCDCVIMQDKQGNEICVNCNIDKKEAIAAGASGDVNPQGQVSGQESLTSTVGSPENQKSNNIALDIHKEQVEKIQREMELSILSEMQRSSLIFDRIKARLGLLPDDPDTILKQSALSHIRDCASTLKIVHNMFTE